MNEENIKTVEQFEEKLPNSGGALTLGIISILTFCCCSGIIGLISSIIGLVLAKQAINEYENNPEKYTEKSLSNAKTGQTCSFIGLILSIIFVIVTIILFVTGMYSSLMENYMELLEELKDY